jgi:hypothetical protein
MFARMAGRAAAALALSGLAVTGTGIAALAHECINSSRSDKGNEMAGSRSQAWYTVGIADFIAEDVANGLYTEEDGACLLDAYTQTGSPLTFTIHVKGVNGQEGVIGERNPNGWLMANGKGIDHFLDLYGGDIVQAFQTCGVTPPF